MTTRGGARRSLIVYAATLALLFIAAVVFETTTSPSRSPLDRGIPCLLPERGGVILHVGKVLPHFFADGDAAAQPKPRTIWYVTRTGADAVAHRLQIGDSIARVSTFPTRLPAAAGTTYDVATWPGRGLAFFALRQTGNTIAVTAQSADRESRVLARGITPDPRPSGRVDRDLFVGRLSGRDPDLFVIDRYRKDKKVKLSVYSGESDFARTLIDDRTLPVRRIAPPTWSLDVARTEDAKLAVVVFRRAAGSIFGRPQVHVVTAGSGFRAAALDTTLATSLAGARQFLVASSRAGPAVYSVTRLRSGLVALGATPFGVPLTSSRC